MTKQFCDVCGHIAADWPSLKEYLPDLKWSGCRTTSGTPNPTEGTWTRYVETRVVFDLHDIKIIRPIRPDLCHECQAKILQQMAANILKSRNV